jgi:hypothetical protein
MIIYHKKKNNNENKQNQTTGTTNDPIDNRKKKKKKKKGGKKKKKKRLLWFLLLDWVVAGWFVVADTKDFIIQQTIKQTNKRRITEMWGAMNVVLCCVGGKIFVVYSAITIIVNGKTKPPSWHQNPHRSSSVPPSVPPPHTLHSFILYLYELPFPTTDNCTNKSCKIFRKDEDFNEEVNFAHDEEEEEEEEEDDDDDDEGDDILHKY